MKQTAVEWLIEQLEWDDSKIARVIGLKKYNQVVSQAKEMEKQQIIKTAINCHFEGVRQSAKTSEDYLKYGEEYYNEIFNK